MKFILAYSLTFVSLFIIAVLINFFITGLEPTTLIQWTVTFFGIEMVVLAVKKIMGDKSTSRSYDGNDMAYNNHNDDVNGGDEYF